MDSCERAIAVIGMACRFPGAGDVTAFWQNLRAGRESIRTLSLEELQAAGVDDALLAHPQYVRSAPTLDHIDIFDAPFFQLSPREAACMDPQQRLFLECAWEVLEDAGYDPFRYAGSIGLFAGAGGCISGYGLALSDHYRRHLGETGGLEHLAIDKDFLASRTSFKLNLRGPSVVVQSACSTSLVAIHLACQSLLTGESDMAIAGGVSIRVPHHAGYLYQEGNILSPDGHCRAFAAEAQGTIFGSGVGLVVLKPLQRALADGDRIDAVMLGSAINNDGADKISYTASSVDGQARAIVEALAFAGVSPDSIGFVEAHGAATIMGDPLEIEALTRAFRQGTKRRQFCGVGTVKSNIGHVEAAAGVAGFIKTVLMLKHGLMPPTLHAERPNPRIDFASSPFFVNVESRSWESGPRRACVNSLGMGGTNAFAVLEQAPARSPSPRAPEAQLLCLSAKSEQALQDLARRFAVHLAEAQDTSFADVCHTAMVGRARFAHRLALVASSREEAAAQLSDFVRGAELADVWTGHAPVHQRVDVQGSNDLHRLAFEFVNGADLENASAGRRVKLPTYPFQRQRYWLDLPRTRTSLETHPLLGIRRVSAGSGEVTHETTFDGTQLPFLLDHRIFGKLVVPGAAFVSMMLQAGHGVLEEIEFVRPLALTGEHTVQIVESHGELQVFSRSESGDWTLHARARVRRDQRSTRDDLCKIPNVQRPSPPHPRPLSPEGRGETDAAHLREYKSSQQVTRDEVYANYHRVGLELGSAFHGIRTVAASGARADGAVVAPEAIAPTVEQFVFHPVLLDCCFQLVGAGDIDGRLASALFIPWRMDRLFVTRRVAREFACQVVIRSRTDQTITADLSVLDSSGIVIAGIEGLTLKKVTREALEQSIVGRQWQWRCNGRGTLDCLQLSPFECPAPGDDEIKIDIRAAGLNFRDVLNVLDMYPGGAGALGLECSGIVVEVGRNVSVFRPGDRVFGFARGTFADAVVTPAGNVTHIPDALSFEEAATLPVVFVTAALALRPLSKVNRRLRVLIHAGTGGVGMAAIQLAHAIGAEIFATCSQAKRQHLVDLGVPHVLDSRTLNFAAEVAKLTDGAGVDLVLNSLAGDFIPASLSCVTAGGTFVEIGKQDIWTAEQVARTRPDVTYRVLALDRMIDAADPSLAVELQELSGALQAGTLRPLPFTSLPLNKANDAFRMMQQAKHVGKIVLTSKAISAPRTQGAVPPQRFDPHQDMEGYLITQIRAVLGSSDPLDPHADFFDLGLDSLMTVELRNRLRGDLAEIALAPTVIFDHPTIASLAAHLVELVQARRHAA